MNEETEKYVDEFRDKLNTLMDKFTVKDFRRIHAKFFGALLAVEQGFEKRFPIEKMKYDKEFYGDEDTDT